MILIVSRLLLCYFFFPRLSYGADTLVVNQSISGNQTLVSLAGNFEMGFFRPGKSPNYYLGIWYNKGIVTYETVVWVANRDTPVSDIFSSKLKILDGNLVLVDKSNTEIWSTNMTSSTPTYSASAVLLDDGNLVLRYGSSSNPIWQSFGHPTHTFLPGSKFGYDKRTNSKQVFTSWRSPEDPAVGLFSLELHQYEKRHVIKWNKSVEYWTSGPWNGQIFSLMPEMKYNSIFNFSYIDNANESYFTYSLYNPSIISRLIIDVSGQTQQLIWLESTKRWSMISARPKELCQVYANCGAFGVCSQQKFPFCNCLTAFEPTTESDWNLNSFSSGCVRKTELNCKVIPGFIESYVRVKFLSSVLENKTLLLDESACRWSCLDECSCHAYSFMLEICWLWYSENMNNISLEFVSDESDVEKFKLNIKVASKDLLHHKKKNDGTLVAVAGSVAGGVVSVFGLFLLIIYRKKRVLVGKEAMEGFLVAFVYRDLQIATKNFSDELGRGGFGSVFKGVLSDSTIVAVKKLGSICQGEKQFRCEVSTIGTIQHVNLVRLRGFCAQGNSKLLVYDYMPNGSLHSHLFHEKQVLSWKTRYEIALGIARGLVYLHEKCRDCIIHCDIKPENILLDTDFCPKIADFGLAKLVGREFSRVLTTMRGTRGYLAPEWLSGAAVTTKVDVFSYGMMLFELVHGERNSQVSEDLCYTFFPSLAASVVMMEGDILSLLDGRLNREANVDQVTKIFKVAYWCIQDKEDSRPSMSQVEHILEGVFDVNMPPIPQLVQFFADNMDHNLFFNESTSTGSS